MESRFKTILGKISKPVKTHLSLTDDLKEWNDFNGLDQLAFKEIRLVAQAISEASIALDQFEDANLRAEEAYEELFSYMNSDVLRGLLSDGIDLMGNFEVLSDELGVDPNTSEAYTTVREQTITDYPELIGETEEVERNADRYFSRTSGL
jgi:hypothetical protein